MKLEVVVETVVVLGLLEELELGNGRPPEIRYLATAFVVLDPRLRSRFPENPSDDLRISPLYHAVGQKYAHVSLEELFATALRQLLMLLLEVLLPFLQGIYSHQIFVDIPVLFLLVSEYHHDGGGGLDDLQVSPIHLALVQATRAGRIIQVILIVGGVL